MATDESIAPCVSDIRKALNDESHGIGETFPKQGYRLNLAPAPDEGTTVSKRRWAGAMAVAVLFALAVTGVTLATRASGPSVLDTTEWVEDQAPCWGMTYRSGRSWRAQSRATRRCARICFSPTSWWGWSDQPGRPGARRSIGGRGRGPALSAGLHAPILKGQLSAAAPLHWQRDNALKAFSFSTLHQVVTPNCPRRLLVSREKTPVPRLEWTGLDNTR